MVKKVQAGLRVDEAEKEYLESSAKKKRLSLTELLLRGGNIVAGFDPDFMAQLSGLSRRFGVSESVILQSLTVDWMARNAAHSEVFGPDSGDAPPFAYTASGPVPVKGLYDGLKHSYVVHFKNAKKE